MVSQTLVREGRQSTSREIESLETTRRDRAEEQDNVHSYHALGDGRGKTKVSTGILDPRRNSGADYVVTLTLNYRVAGEMSDFLCMCLGWTSKSLL